VADLAARRAGVSQVMVPERSAAQSAKPRKDDVAIDALSEPQEMIYDGANAAIRIADR